MQKILIPIFNMKKLRNDYLDFLRTEGRFMFNIGVGLSERKYHIIFEANNWKPRSSKGLPPHPATRNPPTVPHLSGRGRSTPPGLPSPRTSPS